MRRAFQSSVEVGIAVDGPLGPDHVVKRGVLRLAAEYQFEVVPISVASRRKRVLRHRWDHLEIPCL